MDSPALIIRFSSLGDIAQSLFAVEYLSAQNPKRPIHFLTKSDFTDFVSRHPQVSTVHTYDKKSGLLGLIQLALQLRAHNFSLVYDAHNNLRSLLTRLCLFSFQTKMIVRTKNRIKRFLFFKFRQNVFPKPFVGARSFVEPLESIGVVYKSDSKQESKLHYNLTNIPQSFLPKNLNETVLLAPSAAWELKRWPVEHWKKLVQMIPSPIILLGGPTDSMCAEIEKAAPDKINNLAGLLTWTQTCLVIAKSRALISGDTGVLHIADLLGVSNIAIMGPTAFGFPARKSSHTIVQNLPCQPCSKDGNSRCSNSVYKKCLVEISPENVYQELTKLMSKAENT